jgi:hypothetical protein
MVRRLLTRLLWCAAAAVAVGCGSSTTTNITPPTTVRCQPNISSSSSTFGTSGGTGSVAVTVQRECAWTAVADAPWVVITGGREGQGDGAVTYRVNANADPVTRQAGISVNDQRVQLAQEAAPCRFTVSAANTSVPAAGGQINLSIGTHAVCSWTVEVPAPWAIPQPNSGRGAATVQLLVQPNTGAMRTAVVEVEDQSVPLTQTAAADPGPVPPSPSPEPSPPDPGPGPSPTPTPTPGDRIELEGRVSEVRGECPSLQFRLEGRRVFTTRDTEFRRRSCGSLEDGGRVELQGREMSDGTVRADRIEFRRDDDDDRE